MDDLQGRSILVPAESQDDPVAKDQMNSSIPSATQPFIEWQIDFKPCRFLLRGFFLCAASAWVADVKKALHWGAPFLAEGTDAGAITALPPRHHPSGWY